MARRSSSLFSLQPSQYGGLSEFARFGADLPRTGSMQDFIDPSLGGGEGLELEPSEDALDPSTLGQTAEGEYFSTSTGTKFGTDDAISGAQAGGRQVSRVSGTSTAADTDIEPDAGAIAKATLGAATKTETAVGKIRSLLGEDKESTEGLDLSGEEVDWNNPDAVAAWLQKPESKELLSLWGEEFSQSPEGVASMIAGDFDLGDTKLDTRFLDQFETPQVSTITGTKVGGTTPSASPALDQAINIAGTAGSTAAAAGAILNIFNIAGVGNETTQSVATALGGVGNVAKLVQLANSGQLASLTGIASGAGALGAILGVIGQLTNNKDLSMAGSAIGAAAGVVGGIAAATGAAATAIGVSGAATISAALAAGTAAGTAAGSGALAAGTAAISAAAAPVAIALAIFAIMDLAAGGAFTSSLIEQGQGDYPTFNEEVFQNVGRQSQALGVLQASLPYVQSKEELGHLINSYKNYVETTTGIMLDDNRNDPYRIDTIPGTGPRTHGQATPTIDWAGRTQELQASIDKLAESLPGQRITAVYGQPGGGLESLDERARLWDQFVSGGGSLQIPEYITEAQQQELYAPYYLNYGRVPVDTNAVLSRFNAYREPWLAEQQRLSAEEEQRIAAWNAEVANSSPGGF